MRTSIGCPRCGAELDSEAFGGEVLLCCPHCGYLGSVGSRVSETREAASATEQRHKEELWRKEVAHA